MVSRLKNTNGHAPRLTPDLVFNRLMENHQKKNAHNYAASPLFYGRQAALSGTSLDGSHDRNLNKECGYPVNPDTNYYRELFDKHGVGTRVVNIWPDECWNTSPDLYEVEDPALTPFETAWGELTRRVHPWHYLHRADRLSGIGQFGIILLGLDDGRKLDQPVAGFRLDGRPRENKAKSNLLWLRAFDQTLVSVAETEKDTANPRYGQPLRYSVNFADPAVHDPNATYSFAPSAKREKVHWTRVVHLADNRTSSEIYGTPRCQNVVPYLHDLRKIGGGSAEMFWKGAFPGYSFEAWPDAAADLTIDDELLGSIRDQVHAYVNGLQRYLTAVGGSWKSLAPQVADPSKHIEQQLALLCATIGVPLRVFMGSESGHLASMADSTAWKDRLKGRQTNYLEPMVVRPFVDRLIQLGCLPRVDEYKLSWRDIQTVSDKDRADVALKRVQALMQYVTGNVASVLPKRMLYQLFLGLTPDETRAVLDELKKDPAPKLPALPAAGARTQGGGRTGNPGAAAGRKRGGAPSRS